MSEDKAQSRKWLYATLSAINIPVVVLHFLNLYMAVVDMQSRVSNTLALFILIIHISKDIKLIIFYTRMAK